MLPWHVSTVRSHVHVGPIKYPLMLVLVLRSYAHVGTKAYAHPGGYRASVGRKRGVFLVAEARQPGVRIGIAYGAVMRYRMLLRNVYY